MAQTRDELFTAHPAVAAAGGAARMASTGLPYFDYDPAARVLAEVAEAEPKRYEIGTSGDGAYAFTRFATAEFELGGEPLSLELYWLEGYGGGVFLPFADATSGKRHLRRRALRARHGQGRRPRRGRRPPRPRLQLRLQPVVLVRPGLGLPAGDAVEPARGADRGGGALPCSAER